MPTLRISSDTLVAAAALTAMAGAHLWLAGQVGLVADEAYYWVWGQRLAWGYFDHPPAIAALVRAGTTLVGDTELGVRLVPALLGAIGLWPAISLARDRGLAAFALVASPLLWLGGALATPDVPLIAAWSLALWAASRERWAVLGVAAGLAMLSKYTGVLVLPLLLLADPRGALRKGPWVAATVAFCVYLPNALWNVRHHYVSWAFQVGHVAGSETQAGAGSIAFVAAQAALAGPILFLVVVAWALRHLRQAVDWKDEEGRIDRICWWSFLPLLLLATVVGGEANWAAPAWVAGIVGVARMGTRWRRAAWFGAGASMLVSLVGTAHLLSPIFSLGDADPVHRTRGGRILADSVAAWGETPVYTSRYQEAALIHFYSGIPAHALPDTGRADQYDLWDAPPIARAPDSDRWQLLFVRPWRAGGTLATDALGWDHGPPHVVTSYGPTPDPLVDVPVERWQVYQVWRDGHQGTTLTPEAP